MANILVTGGAGFMGSHLTDELIEQGHKVIVIDDLTGGYMENINPKATFHQGSIANHKFVSNVFNSEKFDYVFHLAAYAAEGLSHFIRRFNYTNNLIGSVNLINESIKHNIKCFIYTSSMATYGSNQVPFDESMKPNPEDPYGVAKYAVEMDLKAAKELMGLNYIVFRPHNVYGDRQNIADRYRNVIGIFMNQIMNNKQITIFGDGEQTRAFSYIKDIIPIIAKSMAREDCYGETFNIGGDNKITLNRLADKVCIAMKVHAPEERIVHLETRYEVKHAFVVHDKLRKFFPEYGDTTLIDQGLEKMAKWAKEKGAQETKHFGEYEVTKNIPSFWVK